MGAAATPGLGWPGFRRVRRQVYKRIARRLSELSLTRLSDYRHYLETHSNEWALLDGLVHFDFSFHLILCHMQSWSSPTSWTQCRGGCRSRSRCSYVPGGFFVIGKHEAVPGGMQQLLPSDGRLRIYRAVC